MPLNGFASEARSRAAGEMCWKVVYSLRGTICGESQKPSHHCEGFISLIKTGILKNLHTFTRSDQTD